MSLLPRPIRRVDADDLIELFLVSGVVTVLVTRTFLAATGYPQVGSGIGLHIAHMLWGGLLLLAAFIIAVAFIGQRPRHLAAILGGVGFGLFIDEVGKFLTQDNDYFFRPAFAVMYFAFMMLYLVSRMFQNPRLRSEEGAANALDIAQNSFAGRMDAHQKARAMILAQRLGKNEQGRTLAAFLAALEPRSAAPSAVRRLQNRMSRMYRALIKSPRFETVLMIFFVAGAIGNILMVPRVLAGSGLPLLWLSGFTVMLLLARDSGSRRKKRTALIGLSACLFGLLFVTAIDDLSLARLGFADWGEIMSQVGVGLCVLVGVYNLRSSRLQAYAWFRRAALIAVFLAQFFMFYRLQLLALPILVLNLLVLAVLDYGIHEERKFLVQETIRPI